MATLPGFPMRAYKKWLATRPPAIQAMAKKYPPDRLYRLPDSGRRVTIFSYDEDGTVTVRVSGDHNLLTFERRVFGIDPSSLTECDLPAPDETTGVLLRDQEEIAAYLASLREKLQ